MSFIREFIVRHHILDWQLGWFLIAVVVCLGVLQWFLARKNRIAVGLIVPAVVLITVSPRVGAALFHSIVKNRPNYYTAAALVFPAVWLVCVYLSSYYRQRCHAKPAREEPAAAHKE